MGYYTSRLMAGLGGFDPYASNLIARLTAKGETPTASRQIAMNTAIVALRAEGLFETQFDVLVVTGGYGEYTTKENWIKDSSHALGVNNPTYTAGVGYNSNGTSSYLRTQYTPSINGILYTLNDASCIIKISGAISGGLHGAYNQTGNKILQIGTGGFANAINSSNGIGTRVIGYNCLSRISSSQHDFHTNTSTSRYYSASNYVPDLEIFMLALNYTNKLYTAISEKLVMYALGKSLSQSQFLTFQSIMNTYFASI